MRYTKVKQQAVMGFGPTRAESVTTIDSKKTLAWCPTVDVTFKINGTGTSIPLKAGQVRVLDLSINTHVLDTAALCELMDDV